MSIISGAKSFKGKHVHFLDILSIYFSTFPGFMGMPFGIFCGRIYGWCVWVLNDTTPHNGNLSNPLPRLFTHPARADFVIQ